MIEKVLVAFGWIVMMVLATLIVMSMLAVIPPSPPVVSNIASSSDEICNHSPDSLANRAVLRIIFRTYGVYPTSQSLDELDKWIATLPEDCIKQHYKSWSTWLRNRLGKDELARSESDQVEEIARRFPKPGRDVEDSK